MSQIIVECPHCSQKNRVESDKIQHANCGVCKNPLVEDDSSKIKGRIKFYNDEKGYGFIQDSNYADYFFHIKDVKTDLPLLKNTLVEFDVINENRGKKAVNVYVIKNNDIPPISTYSKPKFINIINERILLSKIKKYTIHSHTFYYRNDKPIPKPPKGSNFFEKLFFNYDEKELYSEMTFNYLKILMFDGSIYRIYSDSVARDIYHNEIIGKGYTSLEMEPANSYSERPKNNSHNKAVKSGFYMEEKSIQFSPEPISTIVDKLDYFFNSI